MITREPDSKKTKNIQNGNKGAGTKKNINKPKKRSKLKSVWHSAVCYDSKTMARFTRETLEMMKFKYHRERSYKHYSKLMVVLPLPGFSYVFQFKIYEPCEFVINLYDTKPTHSGELHLMEIEEVNQDNKEHISQFLIKLVEHMPRQPWRFFWTERFKYAIAAPEYLKAKKAWREMGLNIK